jgi:integrase/recombinase XerC
MFIPQDGGLFEKHYEAHLKVSRSIGEATIRNYLSDARLFWGFIGERYGAIKELALNQKTLAGYISWLTGRGFSSKSISRNISSLRSLVHYLGTIEPSTESFPNLLGKPRVQTAPPSFLNQPQVDALLNGPDLSTLWGLRDACILEILYSTGLRVSELTQINKASVNLDDNSIKVLGKGSKERLAFLTVNCTQLVIHYLETLSASIPGRHLEEQPLFVNRLNGRLSNRSVQRIIKKYAKQAGIDPSTHPHTLRHSFATHMLDGGASLTSVQRLLGHSSTRSTQIYLHPNLEKSREIYQQAHPRASIPTTKTL